MVSKISGRETAEHSCIHAPAFQDAESIVAEHERETYAWPLEKNGRVKKRQMDGGRMIGGSRDAGIPGRHPSEPPTPSKRGMQSTQ
jgi:hypothetical protein